MGFCPSIKRSKHLRVDAGAPRRDVAPARSGMLGWRTTAERLHAFSAPPLRYGLVPVPLAAVIVMTSMVVVPILMLLPVVVTIVIAIVVSLSLGAAEEKETREEKKKELLGHYNT